MTVIKLTNNKKAHYLFRKKKVENREAQVVLERTKIAKSISEFNSKTIPET